MSGVTPSIPETLGISLLGMCVVFVVLIILMAVIYIMTAIMRSPTGKPAAAASVPMVSSETTPAAAPATAVPIQPAEAVPAPQPETISEPVAEKAPPVPVIHKMNIGGVVYETVSEELIPSTAAEPKPSPAPAAAPPAVGADDRAALVSLPSGTIKYSLKVGDAIYETVSEVQETSTAIKPAAVSPSPPPAVQMKKPAPPPVQKTPETTVQPPIPPANNPPTADSGTKDIVFAPLPGTVIAVEVKDGDAVKTGQLLLILEAMKMENEILSPKDGKIVSVVTAHGAAVNAGDPLVVIG